MLRCANGRSLPRGGAVVWDGESGIEVEVAANSMFDRLRNNTLGHLFTLTRAAPSWPGSPTATKQSRWSGRGSVPTWLLPVSTAKPPPDGQAAAAALVTSAESPSSSTDGSTLVLGDHYRSPQSLWLTDRGYAVSREHALAQFRARWTLSDLICHRVADLPLPDDVLVHRSLRHGTLPVWSRRERNWSLSH